MACSNTGGSATALIAIVSGDSMAAIDPVVIVIDPAPGETRYLLTAGNKATPIVRLIVRFLRFSETANYLTYCFNWRPQGDSNLCRGLSKSVAYREGRSENGPTFPLIPLIWSENWSEQITLRSDSRHQSWRNYQFATHRSPRRSHGRRYRSRDSGGIPARPGLVAGSPSAGPSRASATQVSSTIEVVGK